MNNSQLRRFVGQTAIITGAASGIGKASALRFAQEGANIACLDLNETLNQETAQACREYNVESTALVCNVAQEDSVTKAIDTVVDEWGQIDILVAAAGIYSGSPLPDVSVAQWQRLIDINLTGVFLANRAVVPVMIAQKSGSIINISSMAGKTSWPASAEYSASKSGVIGLTRSVAMELAPYGATANTVCPGNTLTEMVKNVAAKVGARDGLSAEEWLQLRADECPMNRMAEPWEIAGVIAFLASADSRYLTGQAIEVDGGMVMS
jgi:NAD(P)-dependent dehydrogenase (short-subunit alcohol dehydrogenase family)